MIDLREHVRGRIIEALGEPAPDERAVALQPPKNRDHGDVAFGAFQVAKQRGVKPPGLAAELAERITPDDLIERIDVIGPFLNFRYRRDAIARAVVAGVLNGEPPFGPAPPDGEKVVIDFSSPNIAKPFHVGHLRSTVIGAALARIHRHVGNRVHGVNHLGDWGMPFAKMMTAYMLWGEEEKLHESPMRYMFSLYVRYGEEAKKEPKLDEEAARHFGRLESGEDNEERRMWQFLRDESLEAFQGPYDRLGVTFDSVTGESFYEDKMEAAMQRVADAGVLEKSEGAEIVDLNELGIEAPCLLRKTDGTTLYHTRDLAAAFYREEQYDPDRLLYVVGAEQKLHFDQLAGVLKRMGDPLADRIEHVAFGLVLSRNPDTGKWEKFASRGGNAIFLDELLDEAVANVRRIIEEKNPELPNKDRVAEQVGVSAIVFNDLKNGRIKDVKFDWEQMLNFDGDTGPYVQFACARLSSILRKAGAESEAETEGEAGSSAEALLADVDFALLADAENVLLTMLEFGPTVRRAADQNEPSVITTLLVKIAGEIHSYLVDHHVLRAEPALQKARLALVAAARDLLATGLALLGATAPREM